MKEETHAEKLERIKKHHQKAREVMLKMYGNDVDATSVISDEEWLIEQAERVQQLEKAIEEKMVSVTTRNYIYSGPDKSISRKFVIEIEELKSALEFYADPKSYGRGIFKPAVVLDSGRLASRTLDKMKYH